MITVISPAKTLDMQSPVPTSLESQPVFNTDAEKLILKLRTLSRPALRKLMNISEKLADENYQRYRQWASEPNREDTRQAILAFKGDVYIGLDAYGFSEADFEQAQKTLRILSGLYGMLRPLDVIQPHRLEMGTKLSVARKKNLYQFWGDKITNELNKALKKSESTHLINLASNEYFKSVNQNKLQATVVTPVFKDFKNGQYKVISFFAKKARGSMAAWLIKNKVENPEQLLAFDGEGYHYNDRLSEGNTLVFTRDN